MMSPVSPVKNPVCSTYGVELVQKLHQVLLQLKDDLFTLTEEKKKRSMTSASTSTCANTDPTVRKCVLRADLRLEVAVRLSRAAV